MKRALRGLIWCAATIALWPAGVCAELLLGLSWNTEEQLQALAAAAPQVRLVTRGKALVSGDQAVLDQLRAQNFEVFFIEEYGPDDRYFLTACTHSPLPEKTASSYVDPSGWALLRLARGDAGYALPHFLYPLPESYSIRGWLTPRPRAKPTALLATEAMAELLARIDSQRLRQHVLTLSLIDPEAPGSRHNLRTRFTVHPEILEGMEYIRGELAASLGATAVELQEFLVDEDRLRAHVHGRIGDEPIDRRAYNVVGVLPGADPEAGYYVICAHYDATGVRTANWDWRTDPAPGADDNATGVALLLESARVLAGQQFPWEIRFIAFSGEELGLLGSLDYASAAAAGDDRILGVFNFDMIGYNDLTDRLEVVANPASRWMADLLVNSNQRYDIGLRVDVLEDETARLSDHAPFWARGYNAILAIENYLPTDPTHYAVREGLYRINAQYHTIADVPDSLNWRLIHKITQLAVASLAQYVLEEGLPNLAVFTGDLRFDGRDHLRAQVANIGTGLLEEPFQVRLSHCAPDSTDCVVFYDALQPTRLAPGQATTVFIPWPGLGDHVFLLEVDPEERIAEETATDNRTFQRLYLQPLERIAVYPNPYHPGDNPLVFAGLPSRSWVRIFALDGGLVWSAREDALEQRQQGARAGEIRWNGQTGQGYLISPGVYLYAIVAADGQVLARDKLAVLR